MPLVIKNKIRSGITKNKSSPNNDLKVSNKRVNTSGANKPVSEPIKIPAINLRMSFINTSHVIKELTHHNMKGHCELNAAALVASYVCVGIFVLIMHTPKQSR